VSDKMRIRATLLRWIIRPTIKTATAEACFWQAWDRRKGWQSDHWCW